jgi:DNA-binding NarL/FixJ family response regulator
VRCGLKALFGEEPDIDVVGEAATGDEAIAATGALRPDVLVLDLRMPGPSGIDVCHEVEHRSPSTHVLVLSSFLEDTAFRMLEGGRVGYLMKDVAPGAIVEAIRGTALGLPVFDPRVTDRLLSRRAEGDGLAGAELSARETEVLTLMAKGLANSEIARELWIALATVKTHVRRILAKLGAADRTHAVVEAIARGLVPTPAADTPRLGAQG